MDPTKMKSGRYGYECNDCCITFRDQFNLSQHLKTRKHSVPAKTIGCSHCRRYFQSVHALRRHLNTLHANRNVRRKSDVQCPLCSTRMYKLLIYDHFQDDHGIILKYEKGEFDSLELFESWKSDFERETVSRFVLYATNHLADGSVKRTYNCQRSGTPKIKPLEQRVHKPRKKGSAKVDGFCPARIIIHANHNGEDVTVDVCTTHVGHGNELGSVDLMFEDRALLASMIAEGLSFEEVLERVRDSMSSSNMDRIHLTTRKDLHNIAKEFKLTKRDTMKRIEDNFGFKLDEESSDVSQGEVFPSIDVGSVRKPEPSEPLTLTCLPDCTVVFDADESALDTSARFEERLEAEPSSSNHRVDFRYRGAAIEQGCLDPYVKDEIVLSLSGADITAQAGNLELMKVIDEEEGVLFVVKR